MLLKQNGSKFSFLCPEDLAYQYALLSLTWGCEAEYSETEYLLQ